MGTHMGAHLVRPILGPENDLSFGAHFWTDLSLFQARPPNTSQAGAKTSAWKTTVPVEFLHLVPVGAHTKLLEGEQTHTFWVRIHCQCGIVCLLCSHLGR